MDPREFAAAQNRETRKITATVRRAIVQTGAPVTDAQREALAKQLLPKVKRARVRVRDLGVEFMETQADAAGVDLAPQPIRDYESRAIVKVLERVTGAPDEKSTERRKVSVTLADPKTRSDVRKRVTVTDENRNDPVVKKVVADRAAASVERHVRNAAREAVSDAAEVAGTEVGWARVLSGAESCPWCAMLASRGPAYNSAEAAGEITERSGRFDAREAKAYHDNCDCVVVPVFDGVPWFGQEHYELLEDLWIESTKGLSAPDSEKAFAAALKKTHLTKLPVTDEDAEGLDERETFDPAPNDSLPEPAVPEVDPTPPPHLTFEEKIAAATSAPEVARAFSEIRPEMAVDGFSEDVDVDTAREYLRTVDALMTKYPETNLTMVSVEKIPDMALGEVFAIVDRGPSDALRMRLNVRAAVSRDWLTSHVREQESSNFHHHGVADEGVTGIITHEFGHVVDFSSGSVTSNPKSFDKTVDRFLTSHPELRNAVDRTAFLKAQTSGYGSLGALGTDSSSPSSMMNSAEVVAEAFMDVEVNGDAAKELSKILHARMLRALRSEPEPDLIDVDPRVFDDGRAARDWASKIWTDTRSSLGAERAKIVTSYTDAAYEILNPALREAALGDSTALRRTINDVQVRDFATDLNDAITAAPRVPEPIVVFRGVSQNIWADPNYPGASPLGAIGEIFTEPAFMSTTLDPDWDDFSSDFLFALTLPAGQRAMYVSGADGQDIDEILSVFGNDESEVILPTKVRYRILAVSKSPEGQWQVSAEVID